VQALVASLGYPVRASRPSVQERQLGEALLHTVLLKQQVDLLKLQLAAITNAPLSTFSAYGSSSFAPSVSVLPAYTPAYSSGGATDVSGVEQRLDVLATRVDALTTQVRLNGMVA
jgi:hypothetical protein